MITAQLATIPERMPILPQVIKSLLPQVDVLNVMLNGHTSTQMDMIRDAFDHSHKLNFFILDNSMTDAAKYYRIEYAHRGYLFTCDDDIAYPDTYVKYMISKIEQYSRKSVISLHGRVFGEFPIRSFYRSRAEMYRCLETVTGDHVVDCAGDGVMAWHSDCLRVKFSDFELPSMSQLWMALVCRKQNIKQIVVEHKEGWLEYLYPENYGETIWEQENENDRVQTSIINERWM